MPHPLYVASSRWLRVTLTLFALVSLAASLLGGGRGYLPVLTLLAATLALGCLPAGALRAILAAMAAASVAIAGLSLGQALYGLPIAHFLPRPSGPFASANFLAGYAVLHVFLAFYLRQQARRPWLWDAVLAANLLAVALAQSRGALAALAVGALFVLAKARPRHAQYALMALGAIALWIEVFSHVSQLHHPALDDPRFAIWRTGWMLAHARLLLGWGIWDGPRYYNVGLDLLISAGILGLGAAIWIAACAWRRAGALPHRGERAALQGFFLAWLVNGLFIYQKPETMIPLAVVLAYLLSLDNDKADAPCVVHDREAGRRDGAGARAAIRLAREG